MNNKPYKKDHNSKIRQFIAKILIIVVTIISYIPYNIIILIARYIGYIFWLFPSYTKKITIINISKCFADETQQAQLALAKLSFIQNFELQAINAYMLIKGHEFALSLIDEVENLELFEQIYQEKNKAAIFITSHFSAFELTNIWCSQHYRLTSLYRPLKNTVFDKFIRDKRQQQNAILVPSNKVGLLNMIKTVAKGGAIGIPADPEPEQSSGEFAPFFQIQALTSLFVPNLINKYHANYLFVHALKLNNNRFKIILSKPDLKPNEQFTTAIMNHEIEKIILRDISQYMWLLKKFKYRPQGEENWYPARTPRNQRGLINKIKYYLNKVFKK